MPHHCSAWGCENQQDVDTKLRGITFHKFPARDKARKQWEVALRRLAFTARPHNRLCSEHFRREDFDMTGQTVRIRDGVVPSVFNFPAHLQRSVKTRISQTSKQAGTAAPQSLSAYCSLPVAVPEPQSDPSHDHSYALPPNPADLKARLREALAKVESLEREKRNAEDRERRAKSTVFGLLEYLKGKDLINEDLKEKLNLYSDLHLLSKQGQEYTKDQRELALTLHLHSPKEKQKEKT